MKGKPVESDVDRMRAVLARSGDPTPAGPSDSREKQDQHVRRLRRRRGAVGGVVLLVAVGFVVVTPHFLKTSPTTNENTDPTNGVAIAADPARIHPCPEDPVNLDVARTTIRLPAEPVSVRLCHAVVSFEAGDARETAAWSEPRDALVADAPRFVEEVNALPQHDAAACSPADTVTAPFAIVVRYADAVRVLGSPTPTCFPIPVGDREIDSSDLLRTYAGIAGWSLPWEQ